MKIFLNILYYFFLMAMSVPGYSAGGAKDLLDLDGEPLRIGLNLEMDPKTCVTIVSQVAAERATRTELRRNCKIQNDRLRLKGFPYCERDFCLASSRTAQSKKAEVVATLWNATAYSQSPGFSVALTIFFDANNLAIIDCVDVSSPSFRLDELAALSSYQDFIQKSLKCSEIAKK